MAQLTDEEFARMLQDEENAKASGPAEADFLLAQMLQKEEESKSKTKEKKESVPYVAPPKPEKLPKIQKPKKAKSNPTPICVRRVHADVLQIKQDKMTKQFIKMDESDVTDLEAIVIGPHDTPYEGGIFHFHMTVPDEYPFKPPHVLLMTTDGGRVRFNPNLYAEGKVCLSLLGTWSGPPWSAACKLSTVLTSIQGLIMNERPIQNEPGFESETDPQRIKQYNDFVQFQTLRVAVCQMMELTFSNPIYQDFVDHIDPVFLEKYDFYVSKATEMKERLEGKPAKDTFGSPGHWNFDFTSILRKLPEIKAKVEKRRAERGPGESSAGSDDSSKKRTAPTEVAAGSASKKAKADE